MPVQFATIDEYLATVPADQRALLEHVRRVIHAVAPGAVECFSYGVPAFRLKGKLLVGFAAARKHCSLFTMSGSTVAEFTAELAEFSTSTGTIRFTVDHPLPDALVGRIVASRIAAEG